MRSDRFIKLPALVLNDSSLSLEAIVAYAVLVDASDRNDRSRVRISLKGLSERLQRSRDTARRLLRELMEAQHLRIAESPAGRCPIYRLSHSTDATGSGEQPKASMPPAHSTHEAGTHRAGATRRKRTLNDFNLNDVRRAIKEVAGPSDQLLDVLLALEWPSQKIRDETATIYRQIGGIENESAFVSELKRAMADPSVRNPYAYALARFQRQW